MASLSTPVSPPPSATGLPRVFTVSSATTTARGLPRLRLRLTPTMDMDTPMDTDTVTAMELDTTLATAMDTMVATTAMDTVSAMATATTDKLELSLLIVQYCAIIIVLKIDLSNSKK